MVIFITVGINYTVGQTHTQTQRLRSRELGPTDTTRRIDHSHALLSSKHSTFYVEPIPSRAF